MFSFKKFIDQKIISSEMKSMNSIEEYIDYLQLMANVGYLDKVYLSVYFEHSDYVNDNKIYLDSNEVFKRLISLVSNVLNGKKYSKNFLIGKIDFEEFNKFFQDLEPLSASHEENFFLSYMINRLISENKINSDLAIKVVDYFWRAKNCNNYRKDMMIFSITEKMIFLKSKNFFKLRKQYYNHIQKIYHQIYRSSFLDDVNKHIVSFNLNMVIKNFNELNSESTYKVAVCLSGLYRNHREALKSIKDNIIDPLGADVFVHTWDQKSIWTGIGGFSNYVRVFGNIDPNIVPEEIHDLNKLHIKFKRTYSIIKNPIFENWSAEDIIEILDPKKVIVENQEDFVKSLGNTQNYESRGSLNQIKMFRGLTKSFDLALEYSEYDYIIRLRPDIKVVEKISIDTIKGLKKNVFYTNIGDFGVQDIEFVGSVDTISCLNNFIKKMFKFEKLSLYQNFPLYDAHNIFFSWLLEYNYTFGKDLMKRSLLNMNGEIKIKIPELKSALQDDYDELSESDKIKFNNFFNFMNSSYAG